MSSAADILGSIPSTSTRNRQQDQSQDRAEEIRRKETGKLNQDAFPAHHGSKGYMFMKNIGIDDRQDTSKNRRRHTGNIAR
jgi:hypothetical protein